MAANFIDWGPEYSLGLEEIDAQHRSLFEIINKAWVAIVENAELNTLMALVDELEHYTRTHFSEEEQYMQAIGYPDLEAHKRSHRLFIERIAKEKAAIAAGGLLTLDLLRFLQGWLVEHIQGADKAYSVFSRDKEKSLLRRFFKRFG